MSDVITSASDRGSHEANEPSTEVIDRGETIAVVGAGPHGMSALKSLLAAGIPADGFDRADDVGGNWRFGGPTSRVYESTHLISSKPFTQFPDFPMPDDYPDYPSHRQVFEYFRRYADHFGLRERILFNTEVISVVEAPAEAGQARAGGCRWDMTIRRSDDAEHTMRYDGVVIANGHNWNPKIPQYEGLDEFAGEIVHSAQYKNADVLRRRRVLVVGAGNTGCDIAVESAQNASATYHSTRRGYWYNPKYAFGRPSDQVADSLLALRLPLKVRRVMLKTAQRTIVGDYTKFGLRQPDHDFFETHPVVNQQLVYYVGHGDIVPKPDIDHFEADAVVFEDGTRAEIDVAVFATGYLATFPFLDDAVLDIQAGRPRLGLQMAAPKHQNIWVSGLIQPDSGQWTIAHWQGEAIAAYFRLARSNPAAASAVHAELIADRDRRFSAGTEYKDSSRHYYEIAHQDYLRALEDLLAKIIEADATVSAVPTASALSGAAR